MDGKTSQKQNAINTPLFGEGFLDEHAGSLIQHPQLAIIELVANSLDAGADRIELEWPDVIGGEFSITDNGIGMTQAEFSYRWMYFNYNRPVEQGDGVIFPEGNRASKRKAFGRNGKGRHSMFCFSNQYHVVTWRDGLAAKFKVQREFGDKTKPYSILFEDDFVAEGHGTRLFSRVDNHLLSIDTVKELVWSKFIADPTVDILINGEKIALLDFDKQLVKEVVTVKWGEVPIYFIEGGITGRTSLQNGITWWVEGRSVGDLSWRRMSEPGLFIDRRTSEGKRFTFIVFADILAGEVQYDWTSFKTNTEKARETLSAVEEHIEGWLRRLTSTTRRDEKLHVLEANRKKIALLPNTSKEFVSVLIDELQDRVPTMGEEMLTDAVAVICNLEEARSGRKLLATLSKLNPSDLDTLNDILSKWSIQDAKAVLDELQWRLMLIQELERMVEDPSTNELQQLQPLFEKGLWIFGPEYDTKEFTSNRTLSTVIEHFLLPSKNGYVDQDIKRKRPDFVVLPEQSIGLYACDGYDPDTGDVLGIDKVLIIELKRGGFEITTREIHQAEEYATALRESGKLLPDAKIICFVLGTTVDRRATKREIGEHNETLIYPRTYSSILRLAHARTFNLVEKIKRLNSSMEIDPDIACVLSTPTQPPLTDSIN